MKREWIVKIKRGFSFLEMMGVILLLSGGLFMVFPVIQTIQSSQGDLFFHFKALKIAENHLMELLENSIPAAGESEKTVADSDKTYHLFCSVCAEQTGGRQIHVKVKYVTGKNHETAVFLSTFVYP